MDPYSKDELLTHHPGGTHGDEEASGDDPFFGRVLGRVSKPSRTRVDDDGGYRTFRGWRLRYLGFSRGWL